jgi:predicted metalloprotease
LCEPFTEQVRSAVAKGAERGIVVRIVIKHEYAHFVQKEFNAPTGEGSKAKVEPQADCMAGAAMRYVNPNAESSVKIYFDGIEAYLKRSDSKHGGTAKRMASFMLGYAPPPGQNCDNVIPLG